jgi:hypothetical protein
VNYKICAPSGSDIQESAPRPISSRKGSSHSDRARADAAAALLHRNNAETRSISAMRRLKWSKNVVIVIECLDSHGAATAVQRPVKDISHHHQVVNFEQHKARRRGCVADEFGLHSRCLLTATAFLQ